ncbi:hypothetical protein AeMF1_019544 [Aphanomyces euteiches]|nr:hypothetical protein AeMF1_019544 [Aphanomyces euteiches]
MSETTNSPPVIDAVPPKRRGFTTTLLWKNFLIKRKHPIKWALEILIPLVLLVLLGYLKSLRDDEIIPEGWSNGAGSTESLYMKATNVGNPRVYQTEVTVSGLLLKMATDPWDSRKEDLYMTEEERKVCMAAAFGGNISSDSSSPYACHQCAAATSSLGSWRSSLTTTSRASTSCKH